MVYNNDVLGKGRNETNETKNVSKKKIYIYINSFLFFSRMAPAKAPVGYYPL